jgi:hypothetical protein
MENNNQQKLIVFLNTLLEAERAGVKVLSDMIREVEDGNIKSMMREFLADEGMNCQILSTLIKHHNGEPSGNTGNFVNKIKSLNNQKEKIELLIKGQEWVAKQIRNNRALLNPGSLSFFLESIKVQHEENVDAMRKLLDI